MLEARRAFTLIELSIVLVIVGLMGAFALTFFGGNNNEECHARTQDQLTTIDAALQNFAAMNARLPKPARMNLGSNNAQFGYEATGAITDPLDPGYGTDAPGAGVINTGAVLIGGLPHAVLGLSSDMATDCWGTKFTYAVTNALTSSNMNVGYPSSALGTISVRAGTLGTPLPLTNIASYIIISHGDDKFGGTPLTAGDSAANHCNGSSDPKIDRENCNSDAVFYNSTHNTGETDQYFDDLVTFSAKLQSTEPCPAQVVSWSTCTGNSGEIAHGTSVSVTDATPTDTGSVTITCHDGKLTQSSPSCMAGGPPPASCASEGLSEGEGNYDGACHLTSCCGGAVVNQTLSGPCPAAPYMAGGGNCPAGCDNDASDGLTGGQKYCSGVVIAQGGGNIVCFGGLYGVHPGYPYGCNGSLCQSGSASSVNMGDTSGCSYPNCSNGDTLDEINCLEYVQCTCN